MRAAYWIRERHGSPGSEGRGVAGFALEMHYQDRVCSLAIELTPPLGDGASERDAARDELRRLHAAIGEILAPRLH